MTTQLWAIALVVLGTVVGAGGPILFKLGSKKFSMNPVHILRNPLSLIKNWQVILGCSLYVLSACLLITALRGGELSVLYPIIALSYVWVALLSIKFLGERMNAQKWVGITIIVLSVGFLGISNAYL